MPSSGVRPASSRAIAPAPMADPDRAIEAAPDYPEAYNHRGAARYALGRWASRLHVRAKAPSLGASPTVRGAPPSVTAGVDDLAAGHGGDGPPGAEVDAVLDELDRAVEEAHVDPARVVRLGADHGIIRVAVGVGVPVAEVARQPVRGHHVAVGAADAVGLVGPGAPLAMELALGRPRAGLAVELQRIRHRPLERGTGGGGADARGAQVDHPLAGLGAVRPLDPLAEDGRVRRTVGDRRQ